MPMCREHGLRFPRPRSGEVCLVRALPDNCVLMLCFQLQFLRFESGDCRMPGWQLINGLRAKLPASKYAWI